MSMNSCAKADAGKESAEFAAALKNGDPAAEISQRGAGWNDGLAEKALGLVDRRLRRGSPNLALKVMATGGLFLAGGISPKILPKLTGPPSCRLFSRRAGCVRWWRRFRCTLSPTIKAGLLGAARCASVRASKRQVRRSMPVSSPVEIRTLTTPQELFAAAAEEVVRAANEAVAARGKFTHRPVGRIDSQKSLQFARDQCPHDPSLGSHVFLLGRRAARAVRPIPTATTAWQTKPCCRRFPSLPETFFGSKLKIQTPTAVADAYEKTLRKFFQLDPGRRSAIRSDSSRHGAGRAHRFPFPRY